MSATNRVLTSLSYVLYRYKYKKQLDKIDG